jgi:hypothetical protein
MPSGAIRVQSGALFALGRLIDKAGPIDPVRAVFLERCVAQVCLQTASVGDILAYLAFCSALHQPIVDVRTCQPVSADINRQISGETE